MGSKRAFLPAQKEYVAVIKRSLAIMAASVLSTIAFSFSFSSGTVVGAVTNMATFDNVVTYDDLSAYTEDGMNITVPKDAYDDFDPSNGSGTNTFSGGFHYPNAGAYGATHISLIGGGTFNAIDMSEGNGWYSTTTYLAYWGYNGATLLGSGTAALVAGAQMGFTDGGGITDLYIAAFGSAADAEAAGLDSFQAIAIDNVRMGTVPEPGTLAALGLGLVALARLRRKA